MKGIYFQPSGEIIVVPSVMMKGAGMLARWWLSEDFRVIAQDDSFLLLLSCFYTIVNMLAH